MSEIAKALVKQAKKPAEKPISGAARHTKNWLVEQESL
jgi:hypothetical protein